MFNITLKEKFTADQWWLPELQAAVENGTPDQKRAVAVVRNLLRQIAEAPGSEARDVDEGAEGYFKTERKPTVGGAFEAGFKAGRRSPQVFSVAATAYQVIGAMSCDLPDSDEITRALDYFSALANEEDPEELGAFVVDWASDTWVQVTEEFLADPPDWFYDGMWACKPGGTPQLVFQPIGGAELDAVSGYLVRPFRVPPAPPAMEG